MVTFVAIRARPSSAKIFMRRSAASTYCGRAHVRAYAGVSHRSARHDNTTTVCNPTYVALSVATASKKRDVERGKLNGPNGETTMSVRLRQTFFCVVFLSRMTVNSIVTAGLLTTSTLGW